MLWLTARVWFSLTTEFVASCRLPLRRTWTTRTAPPRGEYRGGVQCLCIGIQPYLAQPYPINSVVRLNHTHAVSHNICGLCVPSVASLGLRLNWESELQDFSGVLTHHCFIQAAAEAHSDDSDSPSERIIPEEGPKPLHRSTAISNAAAPLISHTDFGAATHPGVGGGTYRRRATFDRC